MDENDLLTAVQDGDLTSGQALALTLGEAIDKHGWGWTFEFAYQAAEERARQVGSEADFFEKASVALDRHHVERIEDLPPKARDALERRAEVVGISTDATSLLLAVSKYLSAP